MKLKFSHVDILVRDLDESVEYYKTIFKCVASPPIVWNRNGFHVEYVILFNGSERFYLVKPIAGNLKDMIDDKGEGTIYRHCYTVPDIIEAYRELIEAGVQPEDENQNPLAESDLDSPIGTKIIWLPKKFGSLSIELLEEKGMEEEMARVRATAQ
ncbi:methylmalonyl-CoA epimerase [Pseudomonas syringae pv. theae ICMP 3923]|uniref:VOC family protein n=1 Tax=Pseudomonas syringae TaxID=317 RepID=UPI0002F6D3F9|nr:VOC family protein [Pseudomonas syringae]EPM65523.1 methylmalonyl-CoA epimerase [Pseudomonas syringae pv. theae ICMP 3923]KPZ35047.1 hypothetical protein AN901_203863 [Pseudomonas syringae pv. theae]MBL3873046.1 methylmalonyl-CoA epimerase [Pseudomonas syringae pv. theae]GKQ33258.1 VOC family protein [Pseudomonas syringae pv. theae]GKS08652.1 VOC family protein [Pseudomonas syringae pv. theae]